jgi:regulator of nonsense transcripts 2
VLISTKNSRKRLIKALLAVPRQRTDLLPFYSRLTAILSREVFKDIGTAVVDQLEKDFHWNVKKGKTDQAGFFIEEKIKNIRFIGELIKFRVTPTHIAFHCLKVLLNSNGQGLAG